MDIKTKQKWLPHFIDFLGHLSVETKDDGVIRLKDQLFPAQMMFLESICQGLDNDVHHFVFLKARQLGITTISLALDLFWLMVNDNTQGALICDTDGNRDRFRVILEKYIESLPKGARVPIKKHNRTVLVLENGSVLDYLVAGKRKNSDLGRGRALNFLHACMAPGTQVITKNGKIKSVEDVVIGDEIITHNGNPSKVIDVCGQENNKGSLIKITPWLGESISYTREHWIPTQRGMVEAGDIEKDDWLIMPIRKIQKKREYITLPVSGKNKIGGGKDSVGSGAKICLTEDFGFFCGYYLAEGHIYLQTGTERKPLGCAIAFARHRKEKEYADRAIAAVLPYITSRKTDDRKESLTSTDKIYGASLSTWVMNTFGRTKDKMIPDEVFEWGEDFCRGLVRGILCGDGSKTKTFVNKKYLANRVVLPTIHSSIAMQTRDLAASLGFGWGACSYRPERFIRGRNEKEQWRITWCGEPALKLRALMGLESSGGLQSKSNKWKQVDDKIFIKIRKIERNIESDVIWDISVEHEDHTFRTPWMSTSNTEVSSYGDQDAVSSLMATLSEKHPDRLYIFESTAKGFNLFWDMWESAVNDEETQKGTFIGWWAKDSYRVDKKSDVYKKYWETEPHLTEEEGELVNKCPVEISSEQIAWYRWKQATRISGEGMMSQEYPWTPEQAFISTGRGFFPRKQVAENILHMEKEPVPYKGFWYKMTESMGDLELIPAESREQSSLKIWETPSRFGRYVIGFDPSYGGSPDCDNHAIIVFRCYADKLVQVAEFTTSVPETCQVTWALAHLAATYSDCIINLEIFGPGKVVMQELAHQRQLILAGVYKDVANRPDLLDALSSAKWYMYNRPDSPGAGYAYNFSTTVDTKLMILNKMRDCYMTGQIEIRSYPLLCEMQTMEQEGYSVSASGKNRDDRVMATALAVEAWTKWVRPSMIASGQTFKYETDRIASIGQKELSPFHERLITGFIANINETEEHIRQKELWGEWLDS